MDGHKPAKVLGTEHLDDHNDTPYSNECEIGADSIEDIDLIMDLSGANHVEYLHEDEKIEHHSEMAGRSRTFECLVHVLSLSILLHAKNDIEISCIPLFFHRVIETWVDILSNELIFDKIKIKLLSCSRAAIVTTDLSLCIATCTRKAKFFWDEG